MTPNAPTSVQQLARAAVVMAAALDRIADSRSVDEIQKIVKTVQAQVKELADAVT